MVDNLSFLPYSSIDRYISGDINNETAGTGGWPEKPGNV